MPKKSIKSELKKPGALLFIDTNIYLDFYRAEDPKFQASMTEYLVKNKKKLIITDQVIMEYLKNRQSVITESYYAMKQPSWDYKIPACVSEINEYQLIKQNKEKINRNMNELKKMFIRILQNPHKKDRIYQFFLNTHINKFPYYLSRENEIKYNINSLAKERFQLGCPPRKKSDTSIGDSINWEWIMYCANKSKKDILLVSRDSDYGKSIGDEFILNDFLQYELRNKIDKNIKVHLIGKLSDALKIIGEDINKEIIVQENQIISLGNG